jgi:hypothetical protein
VSPRKTKQPEKSEKAEKLEKSEAPSESSIRNSPATRALHFLLGKVTAGEATLLEAAVPSTIELQTDSLLTKTDIDRDITEKQEISDNINLFDIAPSEKQQNLASSIGASSIGASSESQLRESHATQLTQSQLTQSQLTQSQLLASYQQNQPTEVSSEQLTINWRAVEHTRVPQIVFDEILPSLPPLAQLPYLQLLRLTLGFQRASCHISLETWATRCNQSLASIKRHALLLQQRGLLVKDSVVFGGTGRGSYFRPIIPGILNDNLSSENNIKNHKTRKSQLTQSQLLASQLTQSQLTASYMKSDHDDDHEIKEDHHHERDVMMMYKKITGNEITRADAIAYQKVSHIPTQQLLEQIYQISQRTAEPIGSFAYFVTAIEKAQKAAENPQTRAAQKRSLEKVVSRIRQGQIGSRTTLSDLIEEIKQACLRDNVTYNNDLINEILGV